MSSILIGSKRASKATGQIHFTDKEPYNSEIERYIKNALFMVKHLKTHLVKQVFIEGYSYASQVSSVYPMAENCAILKYHLHREGIDFDVIPPARVKKIATGKGNAKKGDMYTAWINSGGEDIETTLDTSRESNPISDIIDSFFVLKARSHHLTAKLSEKLNILNSPKNLNQI